MKLLSGMRVRTKLTVMITIMIIGLVSMGVFGLAFIGESNDAMKSMYTQNVISVELLSDARTQERANFANLLNLMVTKDASHQKEILENYNTRVESINSDLEKYTKLEFDNYETKQYEKIKTNIEKWDKVSNEILDYIEASNVEEAEHLFQESGESCFEELQTTIRDLLNYNTNKAEKLYQDYRKSGESAANITGMYLVVLSIICIVLAIIISASITKPVKKIVEIIEKTARLDFTTDSSNQILIQNKDEFGTIAKTLKNLRDELRKMSGNILSISSNLAASSEELAATTQENAKTVNQVVVAVNEIAQGNNAQAEMVEKTSETVTALAENIERVNKETGKTSKNAGISMEMVEEGQKAVDITIEKMIQNKKVTGSVGEAIDSLSSQMDKVGSIISVISGISEQTNLLSLNASIEAARAGEAGRGFAVVAAEIGKLAHQTAASVNEITGIIEDAIDKNKKTASNNQMAKEIVDEQETAIQIMKESFDKIKSSVEDITKRTQRIADQIEMINASTKQISDQAADISATSEEAAASSQEISASNEEQLASIEMIANAADDLSKMAAELNAEISRFII